MIQQAENEIRIFKKFAKLAPYKIDLSSIMKKEPPEPDISCILSDGTTIAFELVECIDNSVAQSFNDSQNIKKIFDDKLEKLPKEKKEKFKKSFINALISIYFIKGISANKRKSAIPLIFDYLFTLGNTAKGKFNLHSSEELRDIVRWISINRGNLTGTIFEVTDSGSFADPAKVRIETKFNKKYEGNPKIDLLAYYELQPEIPENYWLPLVQEFVENNIKTSAFQRVWIFSVAQNRIIFVYPTL